MGRRKIEKLARRKASSFHPAVELFAEADRELAIPYTLATQTYGIAFTDAVNEDLILRVSAPAFSGELRSIELFAELGTGSRVRDARCGVRLGYFVPDRRQAVCFAVLSRWLRESCWELTATRPPNGPKNDDAIRHSLRRLGADFILPKLIRSPEELYKAFERLFQDYYESVLIPRQAAQA